GFSFSVPVVSAAAQLVDAVLLFLPRRDDLLRRKILALAVFLAEQQAFLLHLRQPLARLRALRGAFGGLALCLCLRVGRFLFGGLKLRDPRLALFARLRHRVAVGGAAVDVELLAGSARAGLVGVLHLAIRADAFVHG